MDIFVKNAVTVVLLCLMLYCAFRQRKYWKALQGNRPQPSVKIGYQLGVLTSIIALAVALYVNTPTCWQLFASIIAMVAFFCLKITFAPTALAVTLAISAIHLQVSNELLLVEVWLGIANALAWCLPEEVRALYAGLSFAWIMVAFLAGPQTEAVGEPSSVDNIADTIGSLQL